MLAPVPSVYPGPLSRVKQAERSCALPSSDEAVADTKGRNVANVPTHSSAGKTRGLFPTCFAPFLNYNSFD